jgi:prepilin-type N-terminal cleavage/methylation domain-containing protein
MTHGDHEGGFSVAELLVTLALLALIAAYATSALQTFSNVRRVEAQLDETAARQSALRSIDISLAGMRPAFNAASDGGLILDFLGTENELHFVAPLDDRLERGGLYRMSYYVDAETRRLMLRYQLRRPNTEAKIESIALLDQVNTLKFRYSSDAANWTDRWSVPNKLPRLIAVEVDAARKIIAIPTAE